MPGDDQPKHRGGSHTARRLGLKGVIVHVTPGEHEALSVAARAEGVTLKEFCRVAALERARAKGK